MVQLRERGYRALTTDSIAAAAGVGKQTIYRWWSSKADVVLEALTEHARAVTAPDGASLEEDVATFFRATFKLARGSRGTGLVLKALMAEAQLDGAFAERFRAFIETRRSALRAVLARHVASGAKGDGSKVEVQLDAMVDMLFGAFWYRLLLDHAPLDSAFADTLGSLAENGLPKASSAGRR